MTMINFLRFYQRSLEAILPTISRWKKQTGNRLEDLAGLCGSNGQGISASSFYNKCNPNESSEGFNLFFREWLITVFETKDPELLTPIAEMIGYDLIPFIQETKDEVKDLISEAQASAAREGLVQANILKALEDGVLTDDELELIEVDVKNSRAESGRLLMLVEKLRRDKKE